MSKAIIHVEVCMETMCEVHSIMSKATIRAEVQMVSHIMCEEYSILIYSYVIWRRINHNKRKYKMQKWRK